MTCRRSVFQALASAGLAVALLANATAAFDQQTPPGIADGSRIPADRPVARRDENSRVAHTELLAKAKQGRIDVYFVGDSITRRWGAADYPQLLAHWRELFRMECRQLRMGRRSHAAHSVAARKR